MISLAPVRQIADAFEKGDRVGRCRFLRQERLRLESLRLACLADHCLRAEDQTPRRTEDQDVDNRRSFAASTHRPSVTMHQYASTIEPVLCCVIWSALEDINIRTTP